MIADIAAIRALAQAPTQRKTVTIPDWGDFVIQHLSTATVFDVQAASAGQEGRITREAAVILLTRAVVAPDLTAEDIALFWDHPDLTLPFQTLLTEVAAFSNLGNAPEAVRAASAGFPAGDEGPDASDGA
jgi:hypothetical protein